MGALGSQLILLGKLGKEGQGCLLNIALYIKAERHDFSILPRSGALPALHGLIARFV